jgi:hypothetical protein
MYGERIAAFCKDYESVFVEKDYTMRSKRETQAFEENSRKCIRTYIYLIYVYLAHTVIEPNPKKQTNSYYNDKYVVFLYHYYAE